MERPYINLDRNLGKKQIFSMTLDKQEQLNQHIQAIASRTCKFVSISEAPMRLPLSGLNL
jgi:hypothetical protein